MSATEAAAVLKLQRIRFYDQTPSPITAIAFAPIPLPPASSLQTPGQASLSAAKGKGAQLPQELGVLIVAKQNGEIDICEYVEPERSENGEESRGGWVLEKTFPTALTHPSISSLVLVLRDPHNFHLTRSYTVPKLADLRLFTGGNKSGDLVERCLTSGRILQAHPLTSPPLWCMAPSPTHNMLAICTSSGHVQYLMLDPPAYNPSSRQSPPSAPTGAPQPLGAPPSHLLRTESLPNKTRTLSLAWGVPKVITDEESGVKIWQETYLVTANSDSSIRKWELPVGKLAGLAPRVRMVARAVVDKAKFQPGKGSKGGNKNTIVWGVAVLPDHTVVSSDALGTVTFWDGASMTQRQSFKTHRADAMWLVVGPDGKSVFTSGPDHRVAQFTLVAAANGRDHWVQSAIKRLHTHDVRAIAIFPPYRPIPSSLAGSAPPINPSTAPILASGGWDMSLVLTPASSPSLTSGGLFNPISTGNTTAFADAMQRRLPYLPAGRSAARVSVSNAKRLVVGRKDRGVTVYRIPAVGDVSEDWKKVLEMEFKVRTHLITSVISPDGKWLAVSDLYETKLFRLEESLIKMNTLQPIRHRTFLSSVIASPSLAHLSLATRGTGASSLLFTPDSGRLIMGLIDSGNVVVVQLPEAETIDEEGEINVLAAFQLRQASAGRAVVALNSTKTKRRHKKKAAAKEEESEDVEMADGDAEEQDESEDEDEEETETSWVSCMASSTDGQLLAVSNLAAQVVIYNMDTLKLHAFLPTLASSPTSLTFPPHKSSLLLITLPSQALQFYNLDTRRLLPPTVQLIKVVTALKTYHDPIAGAAFDFDPSSKSDQGRVILWSSSWVCSINLSLDAIRTATGTQSKTGALTAAQRKKRVRDYYVKAAKNKNSANQEADGQWQTYAGPQDDFKITNKYKPVLALEFLGRDEIMLVERPLADFADQLPAAFFSKRYGT